MIAVVDYGMGNLRSVQKALEKVGYTALVTNNPKQILNARSIVLPGVGAFKDCIYNLKRLNLVEPILNSIKIGKPFLGICLGLQILFTISEEFGETSGLNLIKGKVVRFSSKNTSTTTRLKIPHMGWNSITIRKDLPLFSGIEDGSFFYFVHSYYVIPDDEGVVATTTDYGIEFTSGIQQENIFACQFHPEKSQQIGLRLLKNFGKIS
ncbi:MAG: imidazole glycerol phosphate synthase subunit HisH [Deltaproteobacteria bacterium]|nr:imidazole glycerol phosphate synthase subunit HisH [Deltaproteobacteria bacterium]MCK5420945.1 imidazole glycerol phosphate synthase subunit HisH [Deltaproteobacteria bacterium]MCK5514506.1 imidazole glycerol phosphate synthase subunit HisH [Deltaproteobacteria bacterium]NOQ86051.1 imidazole glycerol phosphate synthase subunit HisH [Deltaproteobacteria bacterium]